MKKLILLFFFTLALHQFGLGQSYFGDNRDIFVVNQDRTDHYTGIQMKQASNHIWEMLADRSHLYFKVSNKFIFGFRDNGDIKILADGDRSITGKGGMLTLNGFNQFDFRSPLVNGRGALTINDDFQVQPSGAAQYNFQVNKDYIELNKTVHNAKGDITLADDRLNFWLWNSKDTNDKKGYYLDGSGVHITGTGMGLHLANTLYAQDNILLEGQGKMLKNGHVQIKGDAISADGQGAAAGAKLLLNDDNGVELKANNAEADQVSTLNVGSGEITITAAKTKLDTEIHGNGDGYVMFSDAPVVTAEKGLLVNTSIKTKDIDITPQSLPFPFPDYVFQKDYDLPTLDEVSDYIGKNGHLPEIPSAKEVESKGYNMPGMDALLLKKIEEITLYLLEFKTKNEALQKANEALRQEVEQLKAKQ